MLSPAREDDDEDDNHLCIKCNSTIMGLDNYVKHRKGSCSKRKYVTELNSNSKTGVGPSISALDPIYSLGADVFFQSLELQSSSKKNPLQSITPPIRDAKPSHSKGVSTDTAIAPRRISPGPGPRGEDWIGGHSLRIVGNEDNQTKLINAVANISGASKKDISNSTYNLTNFNDYKHDEDSRDESEESEEEEDDDQPSNGGKWKPPTNYTGGKWKPGGAEISHHWSSGQVAAPELEDWDLRDEHTGGKWKSDPQEKNAVEDDRDDDDDVPPPGHTSGKWVPGANQADKAQIIQPKIHNKGSVQYWCGPCNRRLGSRTIYEKHLMSNLHLRKTLPENDLDFPGHMDSSSYSVGKRSSKPSQYLNDRLYAYPLNKKKTASETKIIVHKRKQRRPHFVQCPGCKSRVRIHLMGKHLISHYHFRKANIVDDAYKKLILDNIDAIVYQSPFQCSPCKFYTNWLSNFFKHWFSKEHELNISSIDGKLWCSFCKYECESSNDMFLHMSSDEHTEVVAVINRSMPIIIRKKTIFTCNICNMEFRYNIELKYHSKKTGHALQKTATDVYQELHKCQFCGIPFKTSPTLAAHLKRKHRQNVFFCLSCGLTFKSTEDARRHRKSQDHRLRCKERMKNRNGEDVSMEKKCPYCIPERRLKNVTELKKHILQDHPESKRKCHKCGMTFVLSQEVTHHIRSKACKFTESNLLDPKANRMLWHCSQCLYQTDSQAECFFHEALHSIPIKVEGKTTLLKYECPLCHKYFKKQSLVHHVRQHTLEKPYKCQKCGINFTRMSSLVQHNKFKHEENFICTFCSNVFHSKLNLQRHMATHEDGQTFKCSHPGCSFTTNRKYTLQLHRVTHEGRRDHACSHPGCNYAAKTLPQLNRHRLIHSERTRNFSCELCPFRTDRAGHLKRHRQRHSNTKPFRCPYCPYLCATLENLRKHVMNSKKHPGKPMYECKECSEYSTNLAMEFRGHLIEKHNEKFDKNSAKNYISKYCYADKK